MKLKNYVTAFKFLIMLSTGFISSCNNGDDMLLSQNSKEKQVFNKQDSNKSELRSKEHFFKCSEANPQQAKKGTNFTFKFEASPNTVFKNTPIQIRFYPPNGGTYDFDMKYEGISGNFAVFSFSRKLSVVGIYRFEYGYLNNGSFLKLECSKSYSVQVLANQIPTTDDLSSLHYGTLPKGQCVSWVAGKINQMWGRKDFQDLLGTSDRHAKVWKERLENHGYISDLEPKVGDIAWWEKTNAPLGSQYGHVAFVNEVIDRNTIIITEYNYIPKQHGKRTLKRNASRVSEKFPHAFIHVQNSPN